MAGSDTGCLCGIEMLPPEIRREILSLLDLPRLKALVHASPTYHRQYFPDRQYLLCRSLEETLGSVAMDAYAVHQTTTPPTDADLERTEFFETYAKQLSQRCQPLVGKLNEDDAINMAAQYFDSVMPTAEYCGRWMLENLAQVAAKYNQTPHQQTTLRSTETMRLVRAAYRFQLLCQVADPTNRDMGRFAARSTKSLFDAIKAWEVEELFTFYQFAEHTYDKIFDDICWDVHRDNPKFDEQGRPPTPEGAFDLESERDSYLEGVTLRGLSLLRTALFGIKDHGDLVSIMQQNIVSSFIPINSNYSLLRETHVSERYLDQDVMRQSRAMSQSGGDGELNVPSLAWALNWNDVYSIGFGGHASDCLRRWGYVFWDSERLEATGAMEVMTAQWEEEDK